MEKVIHQMWFQGFENMPKKYIPNIETWKEGNPGWEHVFWDEGKIINLIRTKFPDYLESFQLLNKDIKKCDAARYFILYDQGGIYADLDTICHTPIDNLISDFDLEDVDLIFAEESQDAHDEYHWKTNLRNLVSEKYGELRFVGNAILLSNSKCTFWLDFISACFKVSDKSVLESFSTWHLSKFLKRHILKESHIILDWEYMLSTQFVQGTSYFTHSYDATWFNHDSERPWEG